MSNVNSNNPQALDLEFRNAADQLENIRDMLTASSQYHAGIFKSYQYNPALGVDENFRRAIRIAGCGWERDNGNKFVFSCSSNGD